MNDTAVPPARNSRVKWGRIICLAGAVGLCVSFFMPQIRESYFSPQSPEETVAEGETIGHGEPVEIAPVLLPTIGGGGFPVAAWLPDLMPFFAAILLLPVLAFRAVPRLDAAKGVGQFLAWADLAICLAALIAGMGWFMYYCCLLVDLCWDGLGWRVSPPLAYALLAVRICGLALAVIALVRSCLPRKAAAARFALWAYYPVFIASNSVTEDFTYAGLWLSLAASGALVIGSAIDWFQCRPAKETLR